jgi:glyoxylase I family protein
MAMEMTGLTPLIQVFDMPESIAFYCGKLGFEVGASSPEIEGPEGRYFHWAWLRCGDAELMLNTAYDTGKRPPERDAARWAGHRHTCLYIGCPDPDAAYEHLVSKGVEAQPPQIQSYGMKQVYLRDPDGYMLCFQARA